MTGVQTCALPILGDGHIWFELFIIVLLVLGNDLSMWKFYNLLTGANKISSYVDSFLDRAVNATEIATGINAALHGDTKYKWFID